ncbi:MAG: DNA alkylation repair protein [Bacteroidaceae bacterium]|nr:DNA alkylation repair protein [Bacteroidaceae bacterium]
MTEHLHETTKKIKQSLRLSMNGIVSMHQRKQGLDYKINFGVEVPRLKSIAQEYTPDKELANALWQENIRECKLLAIFLMPQEHYSEIAEKWIAETPFTEIADHLAMNILCKLPTATSDALRWIEQGEGLAQYCGYLTLTHLIRKGGRLSPADEEKFCKRISALFTGDANSPLTRTAFTALCRYIDTDESRARSICAIAGEGSKLSAMIADYTGR